MSESKFQIVYGYAPCMWAVLESGGAPVAFFDTFDEAVKWVHRRMQAPIAFDISDIAL
jgi:hypothetical protein